MKPILFLLLFTTVILYSCRKNNGDSASLAPIDVVRYWSIKLTPFFHCPIQESRKFLAPALILPVGSEFRLAAITDVQYNHVAQYTIDPQNYLLSNPGQRAQTIASFFHKVDGAITAMNNSPVGKNRSEIYSGVAREANFLATTKGTKTLLVYSDLFENGTFSMYRAKDVEQLRNHPGRITALFEKQVPLSNLSGISIHLIYQASDFNNAQKFSLIAQWYQSEFEAHHAHVIIQANL